MTTMLDTYRRATADEVEAWEDGRLEDVAVEGATGVFVPVAECACGDLCHYTGAFTASHRRCRLIP